jgi:hypothetical protein
MPPFFCTWDLLKFSPLLKRKWKYLHLKTTLTKNVAAADGEARLDWYLQTDAAPNVVLDRTAQDS